MEAQNEDGLFYSNETTNYYLLYKPNVDYLSNNGAMLNEERAKRISVASRQDDREAVVFGPGKYIGQGDLKPMGITFCQLPYEMHRRVVGA